MKPAEMYQVYFYFLSINTVYKKIHSTYIREYQNTYLATMSMNKLFDVHF